MAPGINGPRNTGTLPKSNRMHDRNREVSSSNQQSTRRFNGRPQHSNNLLDWQPVSDRAKNSNTRFTSAGQKISYQDLVGIVSSSGRQQCNYPEDYNQWQEMSLPVDSGVQTPPHIQPSKPTNVNKMPERSQVQSRLNQIRDYIRATSTMMESLRQSSDPRASAQYDKLSKMVEDLCDSETKLAKLLEDYRGPVDENFYQPQCSNQMERFSKLLDIVNFQDHCLISNLVPTIGFNPSRMNGEGSVSEESLEAQLRKKIEASQQKLLQLQEHQANLGGIRTQMRECLTEARQTQQALLLRENLASNTAASGWDGGNRAESQLLSNESEIESETAALRGKLAALQSKKKQMDNIVAELQAVEMSDRASCSSENSKHAERDKATELEALKQQLEHLKGLMAEATRVRDTFNPSSEPDTAEFNVNPFCCNNEEPNEEETGTPEFYNSLDGNSDSDIYSKCRNSKDQLTVEQIQAATQELKEQQALLQAARAELRRLKNPSTPPTASASSSTPALFLQGSAASSITGSSGTEKKPSNNSNSVSNGEMNQRKKRQCEEFFRNDRSQSSNINKISGPTDGSSRRGSSSHFSHSGTPANIWPTSNPPAADFHEAIIDDVSTSDNLLDIGSQMPTVENGFGINWWNAPIPPVNQPPHSNGSAGLVEYYRQLLMGSQAQQLQMMSTTMQQCCQLLWVQQRELQSIKTSITEIQQQILQVHHRLNSPENREDYANLTRSTTHHLGNTLDAALPPSSSLPNLVSLPNSSPAPAHASTVSSATTQHQQLNNQVPPGNRANNYWDNFRSYSRQNLLSGNPKTVIDSPPGPSGISSISTTTASVHTPLVRDKRNREYGSDNLSLPSTSDSQYPPNRQSQSNLQPQDIPAARNNILSNESSQSQQMENFWEEANSILRTPADVSNDDACSLRHLREKKPISEENDVRQKIDRALQALCNETTNRTVRENCQSSDEDSEAGAHATPLSNNNGTEQPSVLREFMPHPTSFMPQSMPALLVDHFEFEGAAQLENISISLMSQSLTPGYNEDLAEADQSRPEASNQNSTEGSGAGEENTDFHRSTNQNSMALEADREIGDSDDENDGVIVDTSVLDRIPTRLY